MRKKLVLDELIAIELAPELYQYSKEKFSYWELNEEEIDLKSTKLFIIKALKLGYLPTISKLKIAVDDYVVTY